MAAKTKKKTIQAWDIRYTVAGSPFQKDEVVINDIVRDKSQELYMVADGSVFAHNKEEAIIMSIKSIIDRFDYDSSIKSVVIFDDYKKCGYVVAASSCDANQALDFILLQKSPLWGMYKIQLLSQTLQDA
jgi:hypothetical protein